MSHAGMADKLLIKPAAGARPAPPRTRGQIIPKARTKRPVTRRVTRGTTTPGWRASQTDTLAESHSPLTDLGGRAVVCASGPLSLTVTCHYLWRLPIKRRQAPEPSR